MTNCGCCSFVLSNPSHPYSTICQAQEEITGRVGLRTPLPKYTSTLDECLTALAYDAGYWEVLQRKATIVVSWDSDHEPAMVEHTGYSFATALACVDPFQHQGIAYSATRTH